LFIDTENKDINPLNKFNMPTEERSISMQELTYAFSSFAAIISPVSTTMILSALAVNYINTEQTKKSGEEALSSWQLSTYLDVSEDQSAATSLGLGLMNSLIIVSFIGAMTFVLVLLYKYRCMKVLIGYMIFSSTLLLGFLGGQIFLVAIYKYRLNIDWLSYALFMYNFTIVGVLAIFYQKGLPTYINQMYLVLTSVIVAWQLSNFNEWMAWSLLIMLALYDLCAVLAPCGPLKALVNEMSKENAPSMPGLLYEARLPENATRPGRENANNSQRADDGPSPIRGGSSVETLDVENSRHPEPETTTLPLAIAKVYKLPLSLPTPILTLDSSSPTSYLQQNFTPAELQTQVEATFPRRGGRIVGVLNPKGEKRYVVYSKEGEIKRTLVVDKRGKVMEIVQSDDDDGLDDNTIKLGLGDFIFYSVLVSKAAERGFAAFTACFLSVLAGLGGTLVLLAVYHHALPALPLSIFLAVITFVLTIFVIDPWIQVVWRSGPYYI